MRIRTTIAVATVLLAAMAAHPNLLSAQLSPLGAAGKWSGGVTMVDFTEAPYCEWSGTLTLQIQQTGTEIVGQATTEFGKVRRLRDVNLPCAPYAAREDQIAGSVSGSRIQFTIRSANYTGSFTNDLMKGSFTAGALNRGGVRGCFQLTRAGALPSCAP